MSSGRQSTDGSQAADAATTGPRQAGSPRDTGTARSDALDTAPVQTPRLPGRLHIYREDQRNNSTGTFGLREHLRRHRTEHQVREPRAAVRAYRDQVLAMAGCVFRDFFRRIADQRHGLRFEALRCEPLHRRLQRLLRLLLVVLLYSSLVPDPSRCARIG